MSWTENTKGNNRAFSTIQELQCSPLTVDKPTGIKSKTKVIEQTPLKYFRRMFTSSSHDDTNGFFINVDEKFRHLEEMVFLHSSVRYNFDTVAPDLLYVYLKNFPVASAKTGSGYDYHFVIPTIDSSQIGDDMKINYRFPENYSLYIGTQLNLKKFKVQIFYEDKTTGIFALYTGIQYIDFEVLFR